MIRIHSPATGAIPLNLNTFGSFLPGFWTPYRYQRFGGKRWDSTYAGMEGLPGAAPLTPLMAVSEIVTAARERGEGPALALAHRRGPAYVAGAKLYVRLAGSTEEELATRDAELASRVARTRAPATSPTAICRMFVSARLQEVRLSRANGATPPQAVLDKPVVATHGIPKWVTYTALGLSGLGLLLGLANARGGH